MLASTDRLAIQRVDPLIDGIAEVQEQPKLASGRLDLCFTHIVPCLTTPPQIAQLLEGSVGVFDLPDGEARHIIEHLG